MGHQPGDHAHKGQVGVLLNAKPLLQLLLVHGLTRLVLLGVMGVNVGIGGGVVVFGVNAV